MTDFTNFCRHYGLDPSSQHARDQYAEAQANLRALYGAASKAESIEAIDKARSRT